MIGAGISLWVFTHRGSSSHDRAVTAPITTEPATPITADPVATATSKGPVVKLGEIPPARPGLARVVESGPAASKAVALTFDDGFCDACVGDLVAAVERTHAHVTFCPNGAYATIWEHYRRRIRALVAAGEVAICNHTWSHADLRQLSADAVRGELERNETWIEKTFGVTARPYFRPPYGSYSDVTLGVAGELGYSSVVMWSGTLADSTQRSHLYLVAAARHWVKPGAIILAHGNYPGTGAVVGRILKVIKGRGLRTATLPELLG